FAAVTARGGDNSLAILSTVEPLDLPDIRLNARVLQLLNGRAHEPRPKVQVVCFAVPIQPGQLFFLWWHQQLEHEPAEVLPVEVFGQPPQSRRLPFIERLVALRVVTHQNL